MFLYLYYKLFFYQTVVFSIHAIICQSFLSLVARAPHISTFSRNIIFRRCVCNYDVDVYRRFMSCSTRFSVFTSVSVFNFWSICHKVSSFIF